MPGRGKNPTPKPVLEQNKLWWLQTGNLPENRLYDWDPDTAALVQAILELLSENLTVVIRPGSGGRALGISIWQGENRPPARWFGDQDELDAWARAAVAGAAKARAEEPKTGA